MLKHHANDRHITRFLCMKRSSQMSSPDHMAINRSTKKTSDIEKTREKASTQKMYSGFCKLCARQTECFRLLPIRLFLSFCLSAACLLCRLQLSCNKLFINEYLVQIALVVCASKTTATMSTRTVSVVAPCECASM